VVAEKSLIVRLDGAATGVDLGGRRIIKNKNFED